MYAKVLGFARGFGCVAAGVNGPFAFSLGFFAGGLGDGGVKGVVVVVCGAVVVVVGAVVVVPVVVPSVPPEGGGVTGGLLDVSVVVDSVVCVVVDSVVSVVVDSVVCVVVDSVVVVVSVVARQWFSLIPPFFPCGSQSFPFGLGSVVQFWPGELPSEHGVRPGGLGGFAASATADATPATITAASRATMPMGRSRRKVLFTVGPPQLS